MALLPPVNSAAVQILRQNKAISPPTGNRVPAGPAGNDVMATANGVSVESEQTESKPAKDFWDVTRIDPIKMKLKLFEDVGKEFGLVQDDFDSLHQYGMAIRGKIEMIKLKAPGKAYMIFHEIEKNLGLDKLGISLETLVDAMTGADPEASGKLDAALEDKAEELKKKVEENGDMAIGPLRIDANGIYTLLG